MFTPEYMLLSIIGLVLVLVPQFLVKSTFSKYAKVKARGGNTGADVARAMLHNAGIQNVNVAPTQGTLTDHYDPSQKIIRLSEEIYYGDSVAALGVAAHEAGHAIQDHVRYAPMQLRSAFFPAVQFGQTLGPILLMAGLMLRMFLNLSSSLSLLISLAGIVLYATVVVFHFITLPVEINASRRAIYVLSSGGFLTSDELPGAKKVLTAAAFTYIATAMYAIMELVYWIWMLFGRGNRD